MFSRRKTLGGLLLACAFAAAGPAAAEPRPLHIVTASAGGLYHPVGGAICRLINQGRPENGLRCVTETSRGSVANAATLHEGRAELAIMQSDIAADALTGSGAFAQEAVPELRLLFVAHAEPFVLVARPESGIRSLADLPGKRIGIGDRGSGQRVAMDRILAELGGRSTGRDLDPQAQNAALCAGTLDAIVMMSGHPNGLIQEAVGACGGRMVPVAGPAIETLIARQSAYAATAVPAGIYPGQDAAIPTFGSHAVVMATAEVPDEVVRATVAAVFANLADFTRLHPVLAGLEAGPMARPIAGLPHHPAALAYFEAQGLAR